MTDNIVDFLIRYIKKCFQQNTDFNNSTFEVNEAYDYNSRLSCPQIAIQVLDDTENEQYTSFEAENVSDFGIQLNVFAENMEIGDKVYEARKASKKISDKLKHYMNNIKFNLLNTNIVRLVRIGRDYTSPLDETGQVYVSVLRFDFQVVNPYSKNLEKI